MLTEPRGRAGVVVGRSLSSALDLGKRGRARAGKERERVMGLFWVRVWGRPKAGAGFVSARTNIGCLIQIRGPDHTQP